MSHVRYIGPFFEETGYGQAARDYAMALHTANVDMDLVSIRPSADRQTFSTRYQPLEQYRNKERHDDAVGTIIHAPLDKAVEVAKYYYTHEKLIQRPATLITTWEVTGLGLGSSVTVDAVKHRFDNIVVPSKFCRTAIQPLDARVVPHAYDPKWWGWGGFKGSATQPFSPSREEFSFYSIGVWSERKNPIGLLKAYYAEFLDVKDVMLYWYGIANIADVGALNRATGVSSRRLPKVTLHQQRLSDDQLRVAHYDNDCYVTASRGEGFGLGAFEARIVGNPVIFPRGTGLDDACDVGTSEWSYSATAVPIVDVMPFDITQTWREPNLAELRIQMRTAYERRRDWVRRCNHNNDFTYRVVGQQLKEVLGIT